MDQSPRQSDQCHPPIVKFVCTVVSHIILWYSSLLSFLTSSASHGSILCRLRAATLSAVKRTSLSCSRRVIRFWGGTAARARLDRDRAELEETLARRCSESLLDGERRGIELQALQARSREHSFCCLVLPFKMCNTPFLLPCSY